METKPDSMARILLCLVTGTFGNAKISMSIPPLDSQMTVFRVAKGLRANR